MVKTRVKIPNGSVETRVYNKSTKASTKGIFYYELLVEIYHIFPDSVRLDREPANFGLYSNHQVLTCKNGGFAAGLVSDVVIERSIFSPTHIQYSAGTPRLFLQKVDQQ